MADTTEPTKKRRATRKTTAETSPKIRVHALAKELGKTSKELIEVLAGLDLKKVAQSTLTVEEVEKVKAALEPPAEEGKDDEKIRTRVRKNVANEISQIEEKVEADLAELLKEQPDVCRAVLRLHHVGMIGLPSGARLQEEHRSAPTADDWVLLVDDWLTGRLARTGLPEDDEVVEAVGHAPRMAQRRTDVNPSERRHHVGGRRRATLDGP